jgi:tetratricopeptide (TPR) repeat protein
VTVAPLYIADRYLAQAQNYAATDPQAALEAVESAQRFNPLDSWLTLREARWAARIGDLPRAEEAYGEATRLNPEHYALYVFQARYYEQVEEPEEALSSYRKALSLNPLDKDLDREVEEFEEKVEAE